MLNSSPAPAPAAPIVDYGRLQRVADAITGHAKFGRLAAIDPALATLWANVEASISGQSFLTKQEADLARADLGKILGALNRANHSAQSLTAVNDGAEYEAAIDDRAGRTVTLRRDAATGAVTDAGGNALGPRFTDVIAQIQQHYADTVVYNVAVTQGPGNVDQFVLTNRAGNVLTVTEGTPGTWLDALTNQPVTLTAEQRKNIDDYRQTVLQPNRAVAEINRIIRVLEGHAAYKAGDPAYTDFVNQRKGLVHVGLSPQDLNAILAEARRLDTAKDTWVNPAPLVAEANKIAGNLTNHPAATALSTQAYAIIVTLGMPAFISAVNAQTYLNDLRAEFARLEDITYKYSDMAALIQDIHNLGIGNLPKKLEAFLNDGARALSARNLSNPVQATTIITNLQAVKAAMEGKAVENALRARIDALRQNADFSRLPAFDQTLINDADKLAKSNAAWDKTAQQFQDALNRVAKAEADLANISKVEAVMGLLGEIAARPAASVLPVADQAIVDAANAALTNPTVAPTAADLDRFAQDLADIKTRNNIAVMDYPGLSRQAGLARSLDAATGALSGPDRQRLADIEKAIAAQSFGDQAAHDTARRELDRFVQDLTAAQQALATVRNEISTALGTVNAFGNRGVLTPEDAKLIADANAALTGNEKDTAKLGDLKDKLDQLARDLAGYVQDYDALGRQLDEIEAMVASGLVPAPSQLSTWRGMVNARRTMHRGQFKGLSDNIARALQRRKTVYDKAYQSLSDKLSKAQGYENDAGFSPADKRTIADIAARVNGRTHTSQKAYDDDAKALAKIAGASERARTKGNRDDILRRLEALINGHAKAAALTAAERTALTEADAYVSAGYPAAGFKRHRDALTAVAERLNRLSNLDYSGLDAVLARIDGLEKLGATLDSAQRTTLDDLRDRINKRSFLDEGDPAAAFATLDGLETNLFGQLIAAVQDVVQKILPR
jgi:hypothetical protein